VDQVGANFGFQPADQLIQEGALVAFLATQHRDGQLGVLLGVNGRTQVEARHQAQQGL
jgi:hypothetical protein